MGIRGELFSTKIVLDNRTYFFNVKENRTGDMYLNIVESKSKEGEAYDRHQIVMFADDMKSFLGGLDESLKYMEKELASKRKKVREQTKAREARALQEGGEKVKTKIMKKPSTRNTDSSQRGPKDTQNKTRTVRSVKRSD